MKAKIVRESLNEDYYSDHNLDVYDKIVDYILGITEFEGTEEEKNIVREEYKDIILNDPYLHDMIERAKYKGEAESFGDVMELARKVYDQIRD